MNFNIRPLERDKWQGHALEFHYFADNYFDIKITLENGDFNVSFVKTPFKPRFEHLPHMEQPDRLFAPHRESVEAWGIVGEGRLIAAVETAVEEWANRLRVTELWIDEGYRRQGIGTALMDIAKERMEKERRRMLILETQSCNEPAICFYLAQGFALVGFESCNYTNDDIKRKEVRMEFGYFNVNV